MKPTASVSTGEARAALHFLPSSFLFSRTLIHFNGFNPLVAGELVKHRPILVYLPKL